MMTAHDNEKQEALRIIREILGTTVSSDRINCLDIKSYIPVCLDNDSRKTICRLYFTANRYIGTISERRVETKVLLRDISQIKKYSDDMRAIVRKYENG